MNKISIINNMEEYLEHTQITSLLKDQMEYIGSPKTNEQIMKTIKLVFESPNSKLMVLSNDGHTIGFAFFNVAVGMESAGKYIWLNEMHIHRLYRSKGYGKILFDAMIDWCKKNDVVRIMGMADETEVRTQNFYKKQGADIYPQQIISYYTMKE